VTGAPRPVPAAVAKVRQSRQQRRIFVLDTNVLMHDPTAIFRFEEHDIYIPMTVLEELDAGKKGVSEAARNVRQVSRFLDELMQSATKKQIDRGLALPTSVPVNHGKRPPLGRLFFQTQLFESALPEGIPGHGADNVLLADTLALQKKFSDARVTLVSKDINLRIKAAIVGVHAEDYSSDKTIEDADLLSSGVQQLPPTFWDKHGKGMESWQQQSRTYYRVRGPLVREWHANQFVYDPGENGVEAIVRKLESESAIGHRSGDDLVHSADAVHRNVRIDLCHFAANGVAEVLSAFTAAEENDCIHGCELAHGHVDMRNAGQIGTVRPDIADDANYG